MKNSQTPDTHDPLNADGYEAQLFETILMHIRKDPHLDPKIRNDVELALFEDTQYREYYHYIQSLYDQGMLDSSYSYAQVQFEKELDAAVKVVEPEKESDERPDPIPIDRRDGWRVWMIAANMLVLLVSVALFTDMFGLKDPVVEGQGTLLSPPTTESPSYAVPLDSYRKDIRHITQLESNTTEFIKSRMHLVFIKPAKKNSQFVARSKNIGAVGQGNNELLVIFPEEAYQAFTDQLMDSLRVRKFPEFIVEGIFLNQSGNELTLTQADASERPVLIVSDVRQADLP